MIIVVGVIFVPIFVLALLAMTLGQFVSPDGKANPQPSATDSHPS